MDYMGIEQNPQKDNQRGKERDTGTIQRWIGRRVSASYRSLLRIIGGGGGASTVGFSPLLGTRLYVGMYVRMYVRM